VHAIVTLEITLVSIAKLLSYSILMKMSKSADDVGFALWGIDTCLTQGKSCGGCCSHLDPLAPNLLNLNLA
jgi:hypothetical protein